MKQAQKETILSSLDSDSVMDKRIKVFFLAIVSIKILVTLVVLPLIAEAIKHTYDISNNPDFYAKIASNLLLGKGYRVFADTTVTMYREPGYVLTLWGIFQLFGRGYFAPRIFNIGFSLITALFLYKIGEEIRMPRNARMIAVLLFLLHPAFFLVETRLGVEGFFTMLTVITCYSMIVAQRKQTIFSFILCGVLSAVTALTRSTIIPFLVAWVAYVIVSSRQTQPVRFKAKTISAYVLTFFLIFSIWPLRNYLLSGKPVVTATVSGDSLFQGMYVNKYKSPENSYYRVLFDSTKEQLRLLENAGMHPEYSGFAYLYATVDEELRHCKLMKNAAIGEYLNNPSFFISTVMNNSISFWTQGGTSTSTMLNRILNVPILIMTLLGIFIQMRRRQYIIPILLPVIFIYMVHLPILATARHHVPTIPFLMLFSGVFISWLLAKAQKNDRSVQPGRVN